MVIVCSQMMTVTIQCVAVWTQPVAYSYTDVDFDSDVWVCLDVDITTLAKSLESH